MALAVRRGCHLPGGSLPTESLGYIANSMMIALAVIASDTERAAKQKISRYIETLASAGQRDAEQLTICGLAYLTELHEGQDPRFTGC